MISAAQIFFESQAVWDESHAAPIVEKLRYAKGDAAQAYRDLEGELDDADAAKHWQDQNAAEIAEFGIDPDQAYAWWKATYLLKSKNRLGDSTDQDGYTGNPPRALSFGRADMSRIEPAHAKKFAAAARTYAKHLHALAAGDNDAFDAAVKAWNKVSQMAGSGEVYDVETSDHLHDYIKSLGTLNDAQEQGRIARAKGYDAERARLLREERDARPAQGSYEHELAVGRIRRNPGGSPDVRAAAVDKYKEFHRLEPEKITSFPKGFKIPTQMIKVGRAVATMYRSGKVDPSTLKKPRRPIDYIHEHDAGVACYMPVDDQSELGDLEIEHGEAVAVPSSFAKAEALVKLGESLGVTFQADGHEDPWDIEVSTPLPEVYCTPDGKCLLVIQGRSEVLAMIWGGGLGVFSRGIDG